MNRKNGQFLWQLCFLTFVAILPVAGMESNEILPIPPILESETLAGGTRLFQLEARESNHEFFEGKLTRTLGYNGSYLGPTIRVSRGDDVVIRVENLSKRYQLGTISHGTLTKDMNSWWARVRKKADPNTKVTNSHHPGRAGENVLPGPKCEGSAGDYRGVRGRAIHRTGVV